MNYYNDYLNFLVEKKILKKDLVNFWTLIDQIAEELKKSSNFNPYWILEETYPQINGLNSKIHDSILIPLHNINVVKRAS